MKKKRYIVLDLVRSNVLGLNPTQSILASCLFGLLSQDPIQYAGKSYYMADYKNISVYCLVLPNKVDTLRRLYKSLENLGLIQLTKIDNHVCFTPSEMLRDWGTDYEYVEAEKNPETGEKSDEQKKNPIKRKRRMMTKLMQRTMRKRRLMTSRRRKRSSGRMPSSLKVE